MRRSAFTVLATVVAMLVVGGLIATAFAGGSDGPTRGEPMASAGADDFLEASSGDPQPAPPAPASAPSPEDVPTPVPSPRDVAAGPTPQRSDEAPPAPQPAGRSGARTETHVASSPRTETFGVLDVGTVTLEIDDVLRVADVQPARPGWRVEVQALGREVEVSFRGDGQRVDWKAEHEDGQVRVRVRDRRAEDSRRGRG